MVRIGAADRVAVRLGARVADEVDPEAVTDCGGAGRVRADLVELDGVVARAADQEARAGVARDLVVADVRAVRARFEHDALDVGHGDARRVHADDVVLDEASGRVGIDKADAGAAVVDDAVRLADPADLSLRALDLDAVPAVAAGKQPGGVGAEVRQRDARVDRRRADADPVRLEAPDREPS